MGKKVIKSSHLALRFYVRDSWNREEIESCMIRGTLDLDNRDSIFGDNAYYRPSVGSVFDVDKLLKIADRVDRYYSGKKRESDKEYLEKFNWS